MIILNLHTYGGEFCLLVMFSQGIDVNNFCLFVHGVNDSVLDIDAA